MKINDFFIKNNIDTSNKELVYIYKIVNKDNNKIYIGKTKDLNRRACEYMSEYNNKTGKQRPIWKKIQEYGIDSFEMVPIDYTYGFKNGAMLEFDWIKKTDSLNPEKGYNVSMQSVISPSSINYKVRKQYAEERMRRSKLFCAINPDTKNIYFSTGLKLFGDVIGRNKDEIKSTARRGTKLEGYYLYYLTNDIFSIQKQFVKKQIIKNNSYKNIYEEFLRLSNYLVDVLINDLNPDKYDIFFIHQSDESSLGYVYDDVSIFKTTYLKFSENKIIEKITK